MTAQSITYETFWALGLGSNLSQSYSCDVALKYVAVLVAHLDLTWLPSFGFALLKGRPLFGYLHLDGPSIQAAPLLAGHCPLSIFSKGAAAGKQ